MAVKGVRELLDEALDAFDDAGVSVAALVRRAIRIAAKRQDYLALIRLHLETFDLSTGKLDHPAFVEARQNLAALIGQEAAEEQVARIVLRQHRDRAGADNKMINPLSIGQIEARVVELTQLIDDYRRPPEGMTEIDTFFVAERHKKIVADLALARRELTMIVERVRQAVHDVLLDMERQLETGQTRPSAFSRAQEYVETAAGRHAPAVVEMFAAAESALDDGTPERLAHALTSCRRVMKALADALYPATGEVIKGADGKERTMDDDSYRNRLLQFAIDALGKTTHGGLVRETLQSLGNRLERLVALSSKGVHAAVERDEAETCVMWTYLTAADVLRLADRAGGEPLGASAEGSD